MAKFFLTTPIFYVNDAPHIGHAYTTVTADSIARWQRLLGNEVFFMTGTDEHGHKVEKAAQSNDRTPKEQADITSQRFKKTWADINITYDDFIRTTEPRHIHAVQAFLQRCYDNGHVYEGSYEGLYSISEETYVTQADIDEGKVSGEVVEMSERNYFFVCPVLKTPCWNGLSKYPTTSLLLATATKPWPSSKLAWMMCRSPESQSIGACPCLGTNLRCSTSGMTHS